MKLMKLDDLVQNNIEYDVTRVYPYNILDKEYAPHW